MKEGIANHTNFLEINIYERNSQCKERKSLPLEGNFQCEWMVKRKNQPMQRKEEPIPLPLERNFPISDG
jgi:hypothetical protein